jgi:uncharacterized protein (DUF1778 family)
MPLSAEERRARARVAINTRHHPDKPELVAADAAELERARTDRIIDEIVKRAPPLTAEQATKLSRLFAYIDPDAEG